MPTPLPTLDGLVPLWDFAVTAGVSEKELIKSLRTDGVHLLEINVSGKRVTFADRSDLAAYITRNANSSWTTDKTATEAAQLDAQARDMSGRMAAQERELQALRAQVEALREGGLR